MGYFSKPLSKYHNKVLPVLIMTFVILFMVFLTIVPFINTMIPGDTVSIAGDWKISLEDNDVFSKPEYDDSSWEKIPIPGSLIRYSNAQKKARKGVCWIRKRIDLKDTQTQLGIVLGRIANADQAFFNGIKIGETGSFPPHEFAAWNHPRHYLLPPGIPLKKHNNVIAIRIYYNQFGDVKGRLAVCSLKNSNQLSGWYGYTHAEDFIHISMGYITIAIGLTLLILFSFFYYRKPLIQENLYYCLQLIAGFPAILEICNYWSIYPNHFFRLKILGIAWVAINVVHPIFLHRIYQFKRKKIEWILWSYLAVMIVFCLFFTQENNLTTNALILILITWCIGFYNLSCHASALVKASPYAKTFGFFGIVVVLCAMNDGLLYLEKISGFSFSVIPFDTMIVHVGAIFLFTGTSLVLVSKYITFADKIENLNANLENFIIENTSLNDALKKKSQAKQNTPISPESKEKIQEVIHYIDTNYCNDLSRNELAESIGLHPDNLGKLFKKITGEKLGDYIYRLRIQDATKKLVESDTKVIDIAFETGFESLRTFNRVFPKFMNTTPDKYRKKYQQKPNKFSD